MNLQEQSKTWLASEDEGGKKGVSVNVFILKICEDAVLENKSYQTFRLSDHKNGIFDKHQQYL